MWRNKNRSILDTRCSQRILSEPYEDSPSPKGVEKVAIPLEELKEVDEAKLVELTNARDHNAHIELSLRRINRANAAPDTAFAGDCDRSKRIKIAWGEWFQGKW